MKFRSIFFVLLSFVFLSCNGQIQKNIKTIDVKAFAEKINTPANPQLLDVRTPEEFNTGHIENADNINWLGDNFIKYAEKYDKTKPIFVYCRSGARSKKATEKLEELGFKNIYEMEGGFLKWDAKGLPQK